MTIGLNMFHVILPKCDAIRALMEKTNFKEKMKSREHFFFIQIYCVVLKQVENIYLV